MRSPSSCEECSGAGSGRERVYCSADREGVEGGRYYIINIWNMKYRYCLTKQIEQVAHLKSYSIINSASIFCKTFPKRIFSFVKLNLSINYIENRREDKI